MNIFGHVFNDLNRIPERSSINLPRAPCSAHARMCVCARRCEKTVRNCSSHGSIRAKRSLIPQHILGVIIGIKQRLHKSVVLCLKIIFYTTNIDSCTENYVFV
ncbi:Uncharacterized protein FWK35_00012218 [Aphis craccivora]|uniref:Uncharacterized protein n=1 Tax=Aphis craccivora TaxID=307492 RepID=A0A6G0ZKY3_APHCR|nr:Uncharacterized protein FWK35_00012218 [Aphis craccivora]